MEQEINQQLKLFAAEFTAVSSLSELEQLQQKFLAKKGLITQLMRQLAQQPPEKKAAWGKSINLAKQKIISRINEKKAQLQQLALSAQLDKEWHDFSVSKSDRGSLHPLSIMQYRLEDLFMNLGFEVMDGPHVESDYYNFEALNFPPDHPARDTQDTFYLSNGHLLRTQTSNVQIRAMEARTPPLRVIGPGKVFRAERVDASHSPVFHQLEGIVVDRGISVANMIHFLQLMLGSVFDKSIKTRIRPGYFPFVEPGFELEINCLLCQGTGCSACKQTGWIEMLGCGLVHPNVLRKSGVDAHEYSGFAFGMGIDRLVMMHYGITDIRELHSRRLDFLQQFRSLRA